MRKLISPCYYFLIRLYYLICILEVNTGIFFYRINVFSISVLGFIKIKIFVTAFPIFFKILNSCKLEKKSIIIVKFVKQI